MILTAFLLAFPQGLEEPYSSTTAQDEVVAELASRVFT